MNQALHPDLHPDAESLNAFMEQALPQPERAQILDHIAACSQCRQVVFLSQLAATAADAPPTPANQPAPWYRNWNLNWRFAFAPELAALALVVVVAVALILRHHPAQPTQFARVTPPAPIASPVPTPRPPAMQSAPNHPVPPPSAKSVDKRAPSDALRQLNEEPVATTAYSGVVAGQIGAASPAYSEQAQSAPASAPFGNGIPANAPAALQPEPAVAAWQDQQRAEAELSTAAKSARATHALYAAKAEAPQSSPGMAEAVAPAMAAKSTIGGGFEPSPLGSAAPQSDTAFRLPSGLAPISIASAHLRTVAIDSDGALYLKQGPSGKWKLVSRQWTGRPVRVRAQWASESDAGPTGAPSATSAPFEMVNDSSLVWISQDGKTWKSK